LTEERAAQQLTKLGGTPLFAKTVTCHIEEGLTVPASVLNSLRREGTEALLEKRAHRPRIPFDLGAAPTPMPTAVPKTTALRLHFADPTWIPDVLPAETELIYIPAQTDILH
jgi:putative protease